jgi:hypothetical protein
MAVITAYYVGELAPADKRRETIGTTEIADYFKQADYPLPSRARQILSDAKNSGYLDARTRGEYSLNPVGYNLAVHGLPRADGETRTKTASRAKRKGSTAKRTAKKLSAKKTSARRTTKAKTTARSRTSRPKTS